ncbi:MAG: DoxX family protein [Bacteroidota bacterium]
MDRNKIIYWVATGIMCAIFTFSAGMYFLNYEAVVGIFEGYNFPGWIVYPLATAKILGVIAVLTKKSDLLKEWAYAGFFFDACLAFTSHLVAGDGGQWASFTVLIALVISRYLDPKVFPKS